MITIDYDNEAKSAVSMRDMSEEHWKAFRKLAMLNDMTLPDYLAHLVEKELERSSN